MSRFYNISTSLKIHLFMNFFYSYFGSQLWNLQHRSICQFYVVWRKAFRTLWHLPYTTHCSLLQAFTFGNNFCSILYNRFVNFSRDYLSSSNVHIKFVSLLVAGSQMHIFGKTYFICQI